LTETDHVQAFATRLATLKNELVEQGRRVQDLLLRAIESFFDRDAAKAEGVIADDRGIDKVDVEIERASIPLLAMGETDEHSIRSVLTIVKVNNELERIADGAVTIAEVVRDSNGVAMTIPPTFRVMANSVVGMLRDTNAALQRTDIARARTVLEFDDTVDRFKREIMTDAERKVASGQFSVEFALRLQSVVRAIERIADHCTNICEQVIYLETGQIVRHLQQGWSQPSRPDEL